MADIGDNFLARFSNNHREEPLQTDYDGTYHNFIAFEYKITYGTGHWDDKKRNTGWVKRSPYELITYFKKRGLEITVFNHVKRKVRE